MKKQKKTDITEAKFKLLFESSPLGIYLATKEGNIIEANEALLSMLGSPSKEATKAINVLHFPPLVERGYTKKFEECVTRGETIEFETPYKTKWGKETYLHSFLVPLKDKDGNVENVYTLINDITEQKRAETVKEIIYNISNAVLTTDNLKDLISFIRNELATLIDTTNFFVALYDDKTDSLSLPFYSDEHDHFTNIPAKKTITRYVIATKKSLLADLNSLAELRNQGKIEWHGTNSLVWLGVPLKVEGKVTGAIVVQSYTDPTAYNESDKKMLEFVSDQIGVAIFRKKAEEMIKKSEERFELAMRASNDGLYDWNLITNEIYYSPRWKSILGYRDDELENSIETWKELTDPESGNLSLERLNYAIENHIDHYDVEFKMRHKDGHWVHILSRAHLIYDDKGKAIRSVGTHFDLTKQKQAEEKLRAALEKAEESDRLKSAFLANMSHEIRTPMNGILGFSDLLDNPNLSKEEISRYVQIIKNSGARLLNIINDLIDISKIEAGQMEINLETYDLNGQLNYLYDFFKPEAESKRLNLVVEPGITDRIILIHTDKEKMYAILTNLLKNAIKYCPSGTIEFGYELKEKNNNPVVEFFVKDTGIGIPPDRQEAIFDRFVQADIEDKKAYEGAGLGLSITKAYVEMLGGEIWLKSNDKGTVFYFTIPYGNNIGKTKQPDATVKKEQVKQNTKKLTILIAEDEEVSYNYLEILLRKLNNPTLLRAKNGQEAVEIVKNNPQIDLILMDVKMPVMGGYDATKQIRTFNKEVIIIAQTAFALEGDREKTEEAGCNDYISKPINKKELIDKINRWL